VNFSKEQHPGIIGVGTDIISIARIGKLKESALRRIFTESEIEYCSIGQRSTEKFAGRFAAKEAVLKALGTGLRNGITWKDVCIQKNDLNMPLVVLSGVAQKVFFEKAGNKISLSIAHDAGYAIAFAVID
jgi:holo-[acyl-carrier protein] synthase